MESWRRALPRERSDVALAAVLMALSLYDLTTQQLGGAYPHAAWEHVGFVIATSVPVAYRREAPLTALICLAVLQTAWIQLLYPLDVQPPLIPFVQLIVVVWSAGAYTDGRAARASIVVVVLGVLTDLPTLLAGKPVALVAGPDVAILIAFGLGLAYARVRRERQRHQERAAVLEAERDRARYEAASAERARIARELHDVVSHDVSLIVLQAAVERRANPSDASAATLASIETTGREALVELRRMLGVLRKDDEDAPLAPQPGLSEVPVLVEQARTAGLPVTLDMHLGTPDLPPGLGIAAYRIVQEALTNSAKHAAGAAVVVAVAARNGQLEIDVTNEPSWSAASELPSGGHGLLGIKERVAIFGGTLDARPVDTGGFRLRACLPLAAGG